MFFKNAVDNGWDLNGLGNGMNLKNVAGPDGVIEHATGQTHPRYTQYLRQRLQAFVDRKGGESAIDGVAARKFLEKEAVSMKNFLEANRGQNINKLFEWVWTP